MKLRISSLFWVWELLFFIFFIPSLSGENILEKDLFIPLYIVPFLRNEIEPQNWISISNKKEVDIAFNIDKLYITCQGGHSKIIDGTLLPRIKEKENFDLHIVLHLNPEKKTCYGVSVFPVNTTFDIKNFPEQSKVLIKHNKSLNQALFITLRNERSVSFTGPNFPEKINTIEENFKIETSIFPGYVVEHFQKSFLRKYWMVVLGLFVLLLFLPSQQDVSS